MEKTKRKEINLINSINKHSRNRMVLPSNTTFRTSIMDSLKSSPNKLGEGFNTINTMNTLNTMNSTITKTPGERLGTSKKKKSSGNMSILFKTISAFKAKTKNKIENKVDPSNFQQKKRDSPNLRKNLLNHNTLAPKIQELDQLYNSTIFAKRDSKNFKSEKKKIENKLMLPRLKSGSADTQANSYLTSQNKTPKLNSKSNTPSQSQFDFANYTNNANNTQMNSKVKNHIKSNSSQKKPKNAKQVIISESDKSKFYKEKYANIPDIMDKILQKRGGRTHSVSINTFNIINPTDKKIIFKVNVNNKEDAKLYNFLVPSEVPTDNENVTENKTNSELDNTERTIKYYQINKAKKNQKEEEVTIDNFEKVAESPPPNLKDHNFHFSDVELNKIPYVKEKEPEKVKIVIDPPKEDIITEEIDFDKTGNLSKLSLVNRNPVFKMNSLVVNPMNLLPKYTLTKTLSLNPSKIKENLKSLNSLKNKERELDSLANNKETIEHPAQMYQLNVNPADSEGNSPTLTFKKKGTQQISDHLTQSNQNISEFEDVTFNNNFNPTLNPTKDKDITFKKLVESSDKLVNNIHSSNEDSESSKSKHVHNNVTPITPTKNINGSNSLKSPREKVIYQNINASGIISANLDVFNKFKTFKSLDSIKQEENVDSSNSDDDKNEVYFKKGNNIEKGIEEIEKEFLNSEISMDREKEIDDVENEGVIGDYIKNKVSEILLKIEKGFESEAQGDDNKYTILLNQRSLIPPQKKKCFTQLNFKSIRDIQSSSKSILNLSPQGELNNLSLIPVKRNLLTIDNTSEQSSSMELTPARIKRENKNKTTNLKYRLSNIRNDVVFKLVEIDAINNQLKENLGNKIEKHIRKIVGDKIKSKVQLHRKKKLLDFYKTAFKYQIDEALNKDEMNLDEIDYNVTDDHNPLNLFDKVNDLFFENYFNTYSQICYELFLSDNLMKSDIKVCLNHTTLFKNFRDGRMRERVARYMPKVNSLISKTKGSLDNFIEFLGPRNLMFVNNYIMRDCMNIFQEEDAKEPSTDNSTYISRTRKKLQTKIWGKKNSEQQLMGFIKQMRRTAVFLSTKKEKKPRIRSYDYNKLKKVVDYGITETSDVEDSLIVPDSPKNGHENFTSYWKKVESERCKSQMNQVNIIKPSYKKKVEPFKFDEFDQAREFSVLASDNIFNRSGHRKLYPGENNKNKSSDFVEDGLDSHFQESNNMPMTKENTLYRTHEIKTNILHILKSTPKMLSFHILDGNFAKFKEIFEKNKVSVDTVDEDLNSLLNLAVQSNSYEIMNYLLNMGADVNLQNKYLNSPLHYALSYKNFKMANLLIAKKADEELTNAKGLTPWQCLGLDKAAISGNQK